MDLLAGYSDDADSNMSNLDKFQQVTSKFEVSPVTDNSNNLEAEWESFEKMIGGEQSKVVSAVPPVGVAPPALQPVVEDVPMDMDSGEDDTMPILMKMTGSPGKTTNHSSRNSLCSSESRASSVESDKRTSLDEVPGVHDQVLEQLTKNGNPLKDELPTKFLSTSRSRSRSASIEQNSKSGSKSRSNSLSSENSNSRSPSPKGHRSRSRSQSRDRKRRGSEKRHRRSRSRSYNKKRHSSRERRHHKDRHRRRSHSKDRKYSRSKGHKRSRSRDRKRSRSRERKRSRSKSHDKQTGSGRGKERRRSRDRKHSRSRSRERRRSRSRERRYRSRRYSRSRSRDRSRSLSYEKESPRVTRAHVPAKNKPVNFKEKMRQQLFNASKLLAEQGTSADGEERESQKDKIAKLDASAIYKNMSGVTPQMALLQTMAAMHQKAQEITGVAVPKYYNPAAVNPLKYAEQVQKRKLLWSKNKEKKQETENAGQWQATAFISDNDGKMNAKFRKLMGMKNDNEPAVDEGKVKELEEIKKKQEELFYHLDKEYEFARMTTHTQRGVGLGFGSQAFTHQ